MKTKSAIARFLKWPDDIGYLFNAKFGREHGHVGLVLYSRLAKWFNRNVLLRGEHDNAKDRRPNQS